MPDLMAGLEALKHYISGSSSESEAEEDELRDESDLPNLQAMKHAAPPSPRHSSEPALPLPAEILSMFGQDKDSPSEQTNPADHQGRIRSFAHTPGNWATFVYIPTDSTSLTNLTDTLVSLVPPAIPLTQSQDLHLSLSRTVCLQHHWIDPFTRGLADRLRGFGAFQCHIDSVQVYTNDDKTRTFLGLKVGVGHESLCKLVNLTDECLSEFSLPVFYKNPSFHLSFCWCVGDVSAKISSEVLKRLQEAVYSHPGSLSIRVDEVHCKSGCKKFVFPVR